MYDFNKVIETPEKWFIQSWEMYEASVVTYKSFTSFTHGSTDNERYRKMGLMKASMLLMGLAVENALKGALISKSKPDLTSGKLDPKHFHKISHDLRSVASKLSLTFSDQENMYFDRLSLFVQWAAKYSAPLRKADYESAEGKLQMKYPSDFETAKTLITTLQKYAGYCENSGWPHLANNVYRDNC